MSWLSWIQKQTVQEDFANTKEIFSGFIERMMVLLQKKRKLANKLLAYPVEQYAQVLQNTIVEWNLDELHENKYAPYLESHRKDLGAACAHALKNISKESPELQYLLLLWIKTAHYISTSKSPAFPLPESCAVGRAKKHKIEDIEATLAKMSIEYLSTTYNVIEWSKTKQHCLGMLLQFMIQCPFTLSIENYIEKLSKCPQNEPAKIMCIMEAFNSLFTRFPQLLPFLLQNLPSTPLLKQLAEKMRSSLFEWVVSRYSAFLKAPVLNSMLEKQTYFEALEKFILIERKHRLSLFPLLINVFESRPPIDNLEVLITVLGANPAFAMQFASCVQHPTFLNFIPKIINLLEICPKGIFELFDLAHAYPNTLCNFIEAQVLAPKLPALNKDKHIIKQDYQIILAIICSSKHPATKARLLTLYEKGEVGKKMMRDLHNLAKRFHISVLERFLDMIQAGGDSTAAALMALSQDIDHRDLFEKLLQLVGSKHAELVSQIISLINSTCTIDQRILQYIHKNHAEVLQNSFFYNLLVLRARKHKHLLTYALKTLEKHSKSRYGILSLIANGRFQLAEVWLRGSDKIIQGLFDKRPDNVLQKIHDLELDLKCLFGQGNRTTALILSTVIKLSENCKNHQFLCRWISHVQFRLSFSPTLMPILFKALQANPRALSTFANKPFSLVKHAIWEITKPLAKAFQEIESSCKHQAAEGGMAPVLPLALAYALITPGGSINANFIGDIKKTHFYFSHTRYILLRDYVVRVLDALEFDHYFSERLMTLQAPAEQSLAALLVEKMLGLPKGSPINAKHARIAVLSALLTPLRQFSAGCCFGSSVAIQTASHKDGLKQLLEDYMSIIGQGKLIRPKPPAPYSCAKAAPAAISRDVLEYELFFDPPEFFQTFKNDNLLTRSYELLVSSTSMGTGIFQHAAVNAWTSLFNAKAGAAFAQTANNQLAKGSSPHPPGAAPAMPWPPKTVCADKNAELQSSTCAAMKRAFKESCCIIYSPNSEHPLFKWKGAWLLLDKATRQPLHKHKADLSAFYAKVFHKTQSELTARYPKQTALIQEIFEKIVPSFAGSKEFTQSFMASLVSSKDADLSTKNPVRYADLLQENPLISYLGGCQNVVIETMHSQPSRKIYLTRYHNPLLCAQAFIHMLTDKEIQCLLDNPSLLFPCVSTDHGFNLKASALLQLEKTGAESVVDLLEKQAHALSKQSITEKTAKEIVAHYFSQQTDSYPNIALSTLHRQLVLKSCPRFSTLQELCIAIVNGDAYFWGEDRREAVIDALNRSIRMHPAMKNHLPEIYNLFDTNWEAPNTAGYTCTLPDFGLRIIFSDANGQLCHSELSLNKISKIAIQRYQDSTSALARTYYEHAPT